MERSFDLRAVWRFAALACWLLLPASLSAGQAGPPELDLFKEPGDAAAVWGKATAGKDAAARLALLNALDVNTIRKFRGLLEHVYAADPEARVYTRAVERWVEMTKGRVKGSLFDVWTTKVRDDYDRCHAGAEALVRALQNDPDSRSTLAGLLYDLLGELAWPQPAAGAKAKVTLTRYRSRPRTVDLSEADAAKMRAHYTRLLELLNRVVPTGVKPSADAPKQLAEWWNVHGGKSLWAARQRELYKARGAAAFVKPQDPVRIITATCLGTECAEWLCGGGIQDDGTVVLVGTSLGPRLEFPGIKTSVLGQDRAAVKEPQPYQGDPRQKPWRWSHPQGTPFVMRLDSEFKKVLSVTRFPWAAGGVTYAVMDPAGNIYITGPRQAGFAGLPAQAQELPAAAAQPAATEKKPSPSPDHPDLYETAYLIKLSPGAGQVLWARTVAGKSVFPPQITLLPGGRVAWVACDLRTLDENGNQENQIALPGRLDGRTEVDVRNGCVWRCGDHQWGTGHEPYRCPYVFANRPDGWRLTLWNPDGPFVGGATGNVADSGITRVRIEPNGDLICGGWADGGNTVFGAEPLDVLRGINRKGFGSGHTTGAARVGHLFRVSAKNYGVTAKTAAAGVGFSDMLVAVDGSLLLVVSSAWGRAPQTDNNISTADPAGQCVLIATGDLTQVRFGSAMNPAGGEVLVGDAENGLGWRMTSVNVKGRSVALFFSGTAPKGDVYGSIATPPQSSPIQKGYAGGPLDGYLLAIDLSSRPRQDKPQEEKK
jgi:hypothetical protein